MTIRTTGQFDATASVPLAGSVFDELSALPSLQMSFEPNPALGATVTSGRVRQIVSAKSFPSNYLTQGTEGQGPPYAATGLNGLPVADFDGVDDQMQFYAAINLTLPHSWVLLFRTDTLGVDQVVLRGGSGAGNEEYIAPFATGQTVYQLGNRSISFPTEATYNLAVFASNAGTLKVWANGVYRESETGGNNTVPNNIQPVLGAYNPASGPTLPFNGQVAWLAYFNADIFASEPTALQLIQDHARYAYGVSF